MLDDALARLFARFGAMRSTTNALIASPLSGSGMPITADSATAGWVIIADSTSAVPMRWPATLSTSSLRPSTEM
jgi:hypothetical protein